MGGGGGDPTEPGYSPIHLDTHAFILTGENLGLEAAVSGTDGTWDISNPTGGIIGAVLDADSASLGGSPYSAVSFFDPSLSGNRFDVLMEEVDDFIDKAGAVTPSEEWEARRSEIEAKIGGPPISNKIAAEDIQFSSEMNADVVLVRDRFTKDYFSFEADVSVAVKTLTENLLEREAERGQLEHENLQIYDNARYTRDTSVSMANALIGYTNSFLTQRAQAISILTKATDVWSTAVRQSVEDELRLSIEDATWDLKLMDFAGKALSSIAGASVIPEGALNENDGVLSTLSTLATVGATIMSI